MAVFTVTPTSTTFSVQVGENTAAAAASATSAAASAQVAGALSGEIYESIALGLAATSNGDEFAVDNDNGTATIYLNNAGSEVSQRIVVIAPANSGTSGLLGHVGSGTGAVARTVQAKLRDVVSEADYSTLTNAKAAAGTSKIILGAGGEVLSPGEVSISRGGFYEGSLGHLNEPGTDNFAKGAESALTVFRGTMSNPDGTLSYARSGAYVEVHNATALTENRSVWGNPFKMSGVTVEHIAHTGAEGEINGASFRGYSEDEPTATDHFKKIIVGASALAQTNTGSGNASWDVFGGNFIAAQTSGNTPQNVVGIEVDVLNSSTSAGLRPGQTGATNYTGFWAQSDAAGVGVQSDTAFLATHTGTSGGWRQILQAEGKINDWAVYITTTVNAPSARGMRVQTEWSADTGRVMELWTGSNEQFRVDGDTADPVWIRVGGALKKVEVGAADSGGTGFRALRVAN